MSETSSAASAAPLRCPECGADVSPEQERCWLCGADLREPSRHAAEAKSAENPYRPPAMERQGGPGQFSLASLILVMTLVAVCLGVLMAAPGLGILLIIVAVPALVRTVVTGSQQKGTGAPLSLGQKVVAFITSLGLMIAVGIAGIIAFEIACWGSCAAVAVVAGEGEGAFYTGLILGAVAGLGAIGYLLYLTMPRRQA